MWKTFCVGTAILLGCLVGCRPTTVDSRLVGVWENSDGRLDEQGQIIEGRLPGSGGVGYRFHFKNSGRYDGNVTVFGELKKTAGDAKNAPWEVVEGLGQSELKILAEGQLMSIRFLDDQRIAIRKADEPLTESIFFRRVAE